MNYHKKPTYALPESEVTPESAYKTRRQMMKGGAAALAVTALSTACRPTRENNAPQGAAPTTGDEADGLEPLVSTNVDELGNSLTDYQDVISYNNFYEFSTDKGKVAKNATKFITNPWQIEVSGLVNNPGIYDLDDLRKKFPSEERIYRLRCVEAWSMVIPWMGFPLAQLLKEVDPMSDAKYVRFVTKLDEDQMPGVSGLFNSSYDWPYNEGLRLDEAMNDLAILATGLYGQDLLAQNGAPIRLVVPWKYGFKSIKSIVSIELTSTMPDNLWRTANPREYGFYANVNPTVDHPRWSQATERVIGKGNRKDTLMFNGYEEQVGYLYAKLDLKENF